MPSERRAAPAPAPRPWADVARLDPQSGQDAEINQAVDTARRYEEQVPARILVDHAERLRKLEQMVDRLVQNAPRVRKLAKRVERRETRVDAGCSPKRAAPRRA